MGGLWAKARDRPVKFNRDKVREAQEEIQTIPEVALLPQRGVEREVGPAWDPDLAWGMVRVRDPVRVWGREVEEVLAAAALGAVDDRSTRRRIIFKEAGIFWETWFPSGGYACSSPAWSSVVERTR